MAESDQLTRLLDNPNEDIGVEIKQWLDLDDVESQACIAQALIALANSGGGRLVVGFSSTDGRYLPVAADARVLAQYTHDRLNAIGLKYCDPQVNLGVRTVSHGRNTFAIVDVPSITNAPMRCRRDGPNGKHVRQNAYYIRKPGPKSEEPKNSEEWKQLIRRCVVNDRSLLLREIGEIVNGPIAREVTAEDSLIQWQAVVDTRFADLIRRDFGTYGSSPFAAGAWKGSYVCAPGLPEPPLGEFRLLIEKAEGRETGWPIGVTMTRAEMAPYADGGCIEAWLASANREPDTCDYWRACPSGRFATVRGFQEDADSKLPPRSHIEYTVPIWRVAELIMHGHRLCVALSAPDGTCLRYRFEWSGLSGRSLISTQGYPMRRADYTCRADSAVAVVEVGNYENVPALLSELVHRSVSTLYEYFEFYQLPKTHVEHELKRMRLL